MLIQLKNSLRITWDDEDEYLSQIITRGKSYLNNISGVDLDFKNDALAIQLLLDYGRYVYNNSFELFEDNFGHELLKLSIREGVKDHAKKDSETSS